jgi:RimJ/RimL family protein N-acetyltransferase
MDGITIRKPKKSDLMGLLKYINELSKEKTFIYQQGEQITKKQEEKWLNNQLNAIRKKQAVYLVAVNKEKEILGVTSIGLKRTVSSHIGSLGISVSKKARGKGLGEKLLREIIKEAKTNLKGLKVIRLEVFGNNKIAKSLYKKVGFKEHGRLPKGLKHRGKYVDDIFMHKNIK